MFTHVPDTLSLVRFRRVITAKLGRHSPNQFAIRAVHRDLGILLDRDRDSLGNRVMDGMTESQRQVHHAALDCRLETDPLDFEFLLEALMNASNHIVYESASESVTGPGIRGFPGT